MATWRYMWNSQVRHYIEREPVTNNMLAVCTAVPSYFSVGGWYGTGTQDEHERIRTLRPCKNCVKKGAPDGPMKDD